MTCELIGKNIGTYRLIEIVGEGGMGAVFKGLAADGSLAAIKILRSHSEAFSSDDSLRRFSDEASAASMVKDDGLVQILSQGTDGQLGPYIAYEFLPHGSLRDRIDKGNFLSPEEAIELLASPVLKALCALHAAGVVHRDIKPENLLATERGTYKVGDLGLAKFAERSSATATGMIVGTPLYLPPERLLSNDHKGSPAGDCYAFAITLVEAMTGNLPFEQMNASQRLDMQMKKSITPGQISAMGVPRVIASILAQAMACNPTKRISSAEEFLSQLEQALLALSTKQGRTLAFKKRAQSNTGERALPKPKLPRKEIAPAAAAIGSAPAAIGSAPATFWRPRAIVLAGLIGAFALFVLQQYLAPAQNSLGSKVVGTGLDWKSRLPNELKSKLEALITPLPQEAITKDFLVLFDRFGRFEKELIDYELNGDGPGSQRKFVSQKSRQFLFAKISEKYGLRLFLKALGQRIRHGKDYSALFQKAFVKYFNGKEKLPLLALMTASFHLEGDDLLQKQSALLRKISHILFAQGRPINVLTRWGKLCHVICLIRRLELVEKYDEKTIANEASAALALFFQNPELLDDEGQIITIALRNLHPDRARKLGFELSKKCSEDEFQKKLTAHLLRCDKDFVKSERERDYLVNYLKAHWVTRTSDERKKNELKVAAYTIFTRKIQWHQEIATLMSGGNTVPNGYLIRTLIDITSCQLGPKIYVDYLTNAWKVPWYSSIAGQERIVWEFRRTFLQRRKDVNRLIYFGYESGFGGMGSRFLSDWHYAKPEIKEKWRKIIHEFNDNESVAILTLLARTFYQDRKYPQAMTYSKQSIDLLQKERKFSSTQLGTREKNAYWLLADATYNNHYRILRTQGLFPQIVELGRKSLKMVEEDFGSRELGLTESASGDFVRLTLMLTYLGQLPRKLVKAEVKERSYRPFLEKMRQRKNKRLPMIEDVLRGL